MSAGDYEVDSNEWHAGVPFREMWYQGTGRMKIIGMPASVHSSRVP